MTTKIAPIHPGEVLAGDFMEPRDLTANALALALRVPASRLRAIVLGKRAITADTALRLELYFDTSAELWMRLQADYDLRVARDANGGRIKREVARAST